MTCCTAAVSTYEGLIVCRIFLGIAEAGFFVRLLFLSVHRSIISGLIIADDQPGIMCYLCFWYKPSERATRMAIFSASVSLSGAFGGLIATGVSFMSGMGGLYGWQWLFILEGVPTIVSRRPTTFCPCLDDSRPLTRGSKALAKLVTEIDN